MTKPSNPNRTGGPQTAEGKRIAATNALKTGVFSKMVTLPGESEEDFLNLESQIFQDFRVEGVVESGMAHDLAALIWKRMRLERIERQVILEALNRPPTSVEFEQVGLKVGKDALMAIQNGIETDPEICEAFVLFSALLDGYIRERKFSVADLGELERDFGEIYDLIVEKARAYGLQDTKPANLAYTQYGNETNQSPLMSFVYEDVKRIFDGQIWAVDHREAIEDGLAKIKDLRLLALMLGEQSARASDTLYRSFYRTLGELRKQQGWRRSMEVLNAVQSNELPRP